jgi:hypothetical protein
MERVYKSWKKSGVRDDQFWPSSLVALRSWNDPEAGIFSWKSPNVDTANGNYADLVKRYWKLRKRGDPISKSNLEGPRTSEVQRLKRQVIKLSQQVGTLTFQIMDYRDAIVLIDPKHSILEEIEFP